jgi:hypothetical protein
MLLSGKQKKGRKATEPGAENVKDDVCDSYVPGSHGLENEIDGPAAWGRHH